MRYSILTVCNKSYFPFLSLFLNSLLKNADTSRINSIFVVDIELGFYRQCLPVSDKIKYLSSAISDGFSGVHSEGWYRATSQKTEHLSWALTQVPHNESILLIDSDVVVLRDFADLIDRRYAMQFTTMAAGSHMSNAGIQIAQIACFVACNQTDATRMFLSDWAAGIEVLREKGAGRPHETPAMNRVIREYQLQKPDFKSGFLDEKVVCADMVIYPETRIVHLKSSGTTTKTPPQNFLDRLQNLKRADGERVEFSLETYLDRSVFEKWCTEYQSPVTNA